VTVDGIALIGTGTMELGSLELGTFCQLLLGTNCETGVTNAGVAASIWPSTKVPLDHVQFCGQ
jgi:hypothetical protein